MKDIKISEETTKKIERLGLAAFNAVELAVNGRPALGAFPLFAVPGGLFLLRHCLGGGASINRLDVEAGKLAPKIAAAAGRAGKVSWCANSGGELAP
jgi:hypothetical protein